MTRWAVAGWFVGLVGCGDDVEPTSEWADSSLQPVEVEPVDPLEVPQLDVRGSLAVRVNGSVWNLSVLPTGVTERIEVEVRTPTNPDILTFDDTEAVMSLREENGAVSVALRNADDEVIYLMEPVRPSSLSDDLFGTGFAAPANDLGPVHDPSWKVRLQSAYVRTDAGDVELFPGEPQEVTIRGVGYRALLVSGYTITEFSPNCVDLVTDRLSIELVQVDPGEAVLTPLTREPTLSLTGAICPAGG